MKIKTLLLFCILFLGHQIPSLKAQVTKGSFFIDKGLNWNFSRIKTIQNNSRFQALTYNPSMGVFLSKSFLLSGGVQLKEERFSFNDAVYTTYGVNLNMRLYLTAPQDQVMLWFLELGGEYARVNIANTFDLSNELNPWMASISLGTDIFLAEGLSINSRLYYRTGKSTTFINSKFSDIGISSGLQYYFLPKGIRPNWSAVSPSSGDWMIGGSMVDIRSNRLAPGKDFTLTLRPRAGVFVHPNIMAGTALLISYFRSLSERQENKNQSFGFTPFIRYYTESAPVLIKGFFEINAGVQRLSSRFKVSGNNGIVIRNNSFTRSFGAVAGLDIFLNPNFALELSFSYNRARSTNPTDRENPTKQQFFNLDFGFQYFITRQP